MVAIGASAGGLEAYKEFLHALPPDTGMAFVLVQHLDPSHESMLTEIIAKATAMPVEEVKAGARIKPDCVYVIPPNAFMSVSDGTFALTQRSKGPGRHLAVNFFMRSLAESHGIGAIGIVFSGTGADGTLGLENIKAEGGITFAQEPSTARYDGMPRSAIDSGCVDFILPPKDIAKELERIRRHPYLLADKETKAEQAKDLEDSATTHAHPEEDLTAVLDQLLKSSGVDFSQYKPNTIRRRTLRRMVILKLDSLNKYAKYLKEHPEEGEKLFEDVLIPVTSFFRDFEAFEALKDQVYPAIVKDRSNKSAIRMWAPGCSTGEETYSLAMTLLEFLGDRAPSFQVQIFGTDLNEKGIERARAGVYRESIAEEISPERMSRFFLKVEGGYRVNKAVRDMCIFAQQNLANDPPFSQMDLVACRNLLIYIQPVLQKKIVPVLHYALRPSGFLVLGSSESLSAFPDLFSIVDKKHKIYSKKPAVSRLPYDFGLAYLPAGNSLQLSGHAERPRSPQEHEIDVQVEADRVVLKNHSPAGVVVNRAMEVIHFRGRTAPYLEQAPGKPSLNVLKLARNGLAVELRTLINAAIKKDAPIRREGVSFNGNGYARTLNLSVTPLGEHVPNGRNFFLILFDDVTPSGTATGKSTQHRKTKEVQEDKPQLKRLRQDLSNAEEALRSAVESEDALKEEFQSANEEILSANEELQSTNEELETSKEELQSTNEELNTLNDELRNRNLELGQANNDLANLLDAIRIPILLVGSDLRIRRLTSLASDVFHVLPSDVGRPITDIRDNLQAPDLATLIRQTISNLVPIQREVQDAGGHWRSLEIRPYRTADNRIEGAVLALPDIDRLKHAEEYLKQIIDNVPTCLLVLDGELKVLLANSIFCSAFHVSPADTVGKSLYHLG
ncbi:MAG TPA: chemotaxis protein CheB, partial [Terriglobia bacterium]|nr:chemotaxis protein CheB [Terriglobia bacterium]